MGVLYRTLNINHGKDKENEGLQNLAQQEQEVHRHRAEKNADIDAGAEAEEDDERHFF